MLGSQAYENSKQHLALALGKNIGGEPIFADLARMPHLLIAGTTGSGKSVGINTMILASSPRALSPCWLTYRQAKQAGGHVRKGEKSTLVVFWKWIDRKEEDPESFVRLPRNSLVGWKEER